MLNKEKAINEIIEEFDFEKVKKVMELLEWTWHDVGIPSIGKLVKTAEKLLNDCFDKCLDNKADYFVGTGGFMVRAFYDKKEIYRLDLTFEITDWSVYEPL